MMDYYDVTAGCCAYWYLRLKDMAVVIGKAKFVSNGAVELLLRTPATPCVASDHLAADELEKCFAEMGGGVRVVMGGDRWGAGGGCSRLEAYQL
jgi:hypothetical protein